ncbi:MAG: hypothetical protein AAF727_01255 [Pseudomonadota bacterium]
MGDIALRGPELKKLVKLAKKRDLNFAYCPGNDPKEDVFVLDRKKKAEVIGRVARAEGTGTKLGLGTAKVKGRVMTMTCTRELPQMCKKLKKFLKSENLPMNIVIMDKDGNVLEEDIEDLAPDPELDGDDDNEAEFEDENDGNNADDGDDAQRLKDLTARAQTVKNAMADVPEQAQAPVSKGFAGVLAALKGGNLDAADDQLTKLEAAVDKLSGQGAAPAQPDAAAIERLNQVADGLGQRIDALGNAQGADQLLGAHGILLAQIQEGDVKKAAGTAKTLSAAVTKVETAAAAAPEENAPEPTDLGAAWRDARVTLEPVALDLLQRNLGDVSKMRTVLSFFVEKGEAGDFEGAMKAEPGLKKLIAQAEAAEQTDAEKDIPAGVVPYVRARLDWVKTRGSLKTELTKLQNAIVAACDPEEFPDIEGESKALFSYIDALDGRLEDALEALVEEPDGTKREALKAKAAKLLAEYQSELDTPFFKDVDSDNGFANVNVRGAAMDSLGKVRSALTAAA